MGAQPLATLLGRVEHAGQTDDVPALLEAASRELTRVCASLREQLGEA